jgi:serine/threonine protein kinase
MAAHGEDLLSPGERFGGYEVAVLLGEGGMGRVYRARAPGGAEVALKVLRAELAKDEGFRKRFDREAEVAARVEHENVVPTLEHGDVDGVFYLTQEFIPGGSLDARLEREGRLAPAEVVRICTEVAGGLDAMHRAGLVHRDVKPPNIMLDMDGRAYVADFGLAKDREARTLLTRLGQAVGSMDYMAPEQIRGDDVDARTDVYSLGCVVAECLSGKAPFAERRGMQVMWGHLRDEPPDPCAERDDVPPGLGAAVMKALQKEPDARPPTATAYAHMLRAAAGIQTEPSAESK